MRRFLLCFALLSIPFIQLTISGYVGVTAIYGTLSSGSSFFPTAVCFMYPFIMGLCKFPLYSLCAPFGGSNGEVFDAFEVVLLGFAAVPFRTVKIGYKMIVGPIFFRLIILQTQKDEEAEEEEEEERNENNKEPLQGAGLSHRAPSAVAALPSPPQLVDTTRAKDDQSGRVVRVKEADLEAAFQVENSLNEASSIADEGSVWRPEAGPASGSANTPGRSGMVSGPTKPFFQNDPMHSMPPPAHTQSFNQAKTFTTSRAASFFATGNTLKERVAHFSRKFIQQQFFDMVSSVAVVIFASASRFAVPSSLFGAMPERVFVLSVTVGAVEPFVEFLLLLATPVIIASSHFKPFLFLESMFSFANPRRLVFATMTMTVANIYLVALMGMPLPPYGFSSF
uniref:Uncharacterized protein n=1 Tax=Chromera velia CCMP2878 TaxID=1169474 RepID=A0A0G4HV63_9ALVE|eukprot:Cvel_8749.t1-p1 / transcript=Cvel_8749.t1 / gene=Cvel_8749 / organism=Chromera_velia_CCMP2878 / gene_product=hypothetical protein / transcript_product=hypothetical protein / location=Cvel_scaffold489:44931-48134(+) / protein_length=394 / sequence_SO=supercontig / SO=protein_coding / is_pseudo=false